MQPETQSITKTQGNTIVDPAPLSTNPNLLSTEPGQLRVIRRNGMLTSYNDSKIAVAITKAFLAVEGPNAASSTRIHGIVAQLTKEVTEAFKRRNPGGGSVHIEAIQDQVELALMRGGFQPVAHAYVIYREARQKERAAKAQETTETKGASQALKVTLNDGKQIPLPKKKLAKMVDWACQALSDVEPEKILEDTYRNLFDGVPIEDVYKAVIMTARTMIEQEPNYSFVAARLLLNTHTREALKFLGIEIDELNPPKMETLYVNCFTRYINRGVELELLDARLADYDLTKLGEALSSQYNNQFTYLGLQTLYDRYFIHHEEVRFELPQIFFMRVAMGLAIDETENREEWAIEFYKQLASFDYMSSTPTLFNAGTRRPQLSSCFLTTVPDDLKGIYSAMRDNALLSKWAGGLGNDWTPVRAMGSYIKGTNGKSSGIVPFLNVADATAVAVNQGGKRKGAVCAYLETWHMDIEEFLDLRKNTGDERRRTHDMNTANWIPDLFMQRLFEDGEWTLFSPNEVPDLHELYGIAFERAYKHYEERAGRGEILSKKIPAINLWRKMLGMLFETGHPWITFKDSCNLRSPQQHVGVIHSSNLCTEITLNTSKDEVAVCNLGSINLMNHLKADGGLDIEKLQKTVKTAIRMLDNVIDINYYAIAQAKNANLRHRPIGMGLMGFQDALQAQGIPYASDEAVKFADQSMETISYYAIQASSELAEERGTYPSYTGSLWNQGILPIDSLELLQKARGKYMEVNRDTTLDWESLRKRVVKAGMRNSNVMAIAPTATIANICGVSQSIEPTYQNLYVKSNLSGEFTVINPQLVRALKKLALWDAVMINDLKYYDGSVQKIDRIPNDLKKIFASAFDIDPLWLIEAASRRQKWIDQAQSLNLYMGQPSGKKLDNLYRMAWLRGLKTTYYLRSLGATNAEKSTVTDGALNAVKLDTTAAVPQACSIDDPDCEACQ